ncbi:hypothetical protein BJ165DRAFT_1411444 [Panaeolus papilionaceus]|nr:hypothetical protein BJ165DRAFT_1411444 [Panaeolus papilionaceus]
MAPFPTPEQLESIEFDNSDDNSLNYQEAPPDQWEINLSPHSISSYSPPPSPVPLLCAPDNTPTGSPSLSFHLPPPQEFSWVVLAGISNLIYLAHAQNRGEGPGNPWPGSSTWDCSLSPIGLDDEEWEQHRWFHDNISEPALRGHLDDDTSLNSPCSSALSTSSDETASFCALSPSPPCRASLARTRIRKGKARATPGVEYLDDDSDDNRQSEDAAEMEDVEEVKDENGAEDENKQAGREGDWDEDVKDKGVLWNLKLTMRKKKICGI